MTSTKAGCIRCGATVAYVVIDQNPDPDAQWAICHTCWETFTSVNPDIYNFWCYMFYQSLPLANKIIEDWAGGKDDGS